MSLSLLTFYLKIVSVSSCHYTGGGVFPQEGDPPPCPVSFSIKIILNIKICRTMVLWIARLQQVCHSTGMKPEDQSGIRPPPLYQEDIENFKDVLDDQSW